MSKKRPYDSSEVGVPSGPCRKCGGATWTHEVEPLTWRCVYCGNRAYYTYGVMRQQIDSIMASDLRNHEFVQSRDGKRILPKINDEVRRIRMRSEMERRKDAERLSRKSA